VSCCAPAGADGAASGAAYHQPSHIEPDFFPLSMHYLDPLENWLLMLYKSNLVDPREIKENLSAIGMYKKRVLGPFASLENPR
jgi:hypothetical protein